MTSYFRSVYNVLGEEVFIIMYIVNTAFIPDLEKRLGKPISWWFFFVLIL